MRRVEIFEDLEEDLVEEGIEMHRCRAWSKDQEWWMLRVWDVYESYVIFLEYGWIVQSYFAHTRCWFSTPFVVFGGKARALEVSYLN